MSSDGGIAVQNSSGITLMEGEEVLHDQRPQWRAYPWSMFLTITTIWVGIGFLPLIWVW